MKIHIEKRNSMRFRRLHRISLLDNNLNKVIYVHSSIFFSNKQEELNYGKN